MFKISHHHHSHFKRLFSMLYGLDGFLKVTVQFETDRNVQNEITCHLERCSCPIIALSFLSKEKPQLDCKMGSLIYTH